MNKKLCVFFTGGFLGGVPTLSYRIGCWLKDHQFEVVYLAEKLTDQSNKNMFEKAGIKTAVLKKAVWKKEIEKCYLNYEEYLLLTYNYEYYYILDNLRNYLYKKHSKIVNSYLYAVLDYCMVRGVQAKDNRLKKAAADFCNRWNRGYARALYQNNRLLMMDELVISTTKDELHIEMPDVEEKVFRIPIFVHTPACQKVKKGKVIITVSRMDFPFKGYLMGLIDDYVYLKEKYPDLKLLIIGDGSDRDKIRKKISQITDKKFKEDIKLTGNVPYQDLIHYFQLARVFVGMGTGTLDAVNHGVPAIPIQAHTYKCRGSSTFDKNPFCVGYGRDKESELEDIRNCIDQILQMNEEDYVFLCEKNQAALKENYDIEQFMKRLLQLQNKSKRNGSVADRFKYRTSIKFADFLHKISRKY